MDSIINTFYKGNINKFGFGGWNTTKSNMKEILWSYPYPSNMGRQIDKYFQKSNIKTGDNSRNIHQNYVPSVYSKVLPPKERVDFSEANAQELKPITISQYKNFDNHGFMNTQTKPVPTENFSPALIRMELLERKMNELEDKARLEMKHNLTEMNDKYIDPRFKKFLDNNQGKYDVFGNDPDPLDQRRKFVKNNLGNIKNKIENDDYRQYKKLKKIKKKIKKKRKKFLEDFEDIQEKNTEEEKEEVPVPEENITDSPLKLIQNINNLPKRNSLLGTPKNKQSIITSPRTSVSKKGFVNNLTKKNSSISPMKSFVRASNPETIRGSVKGSVPRTRRASVKGSVHGSGHVSRRGSVVQSPSRKDSLKRRDSQKKEENQIEKILGDIGYSFEGKTNKEKELQFQTNRIGKDFDRLLHEMKQFQRTIKAKLNIQHSDETVKLNILKDIFLLDNKANMKNAVDRAINNIKEPFDQEAYKKKVDKEKFEEINDLIDKKIEEYNDNVNKNDYGGKIYEEKKQMIHSNIINKHEYQKYRQKVNNKIATLPSIFIKASKMIISKEDNKNKASKNSNISSTQSTESKVHIFKKIKEETIHFGDTVKEDSEFKSNDQISQLPPINQEREKKENVDNKNEIWLSDNEGDKKGKLKSEENKTKSKSNSKKSKNTKKSDKKKETSKTKEEKEKNEEKEDNENEEDENEEEDDEEEEEEEDDEEEEEDDDEEEDKEEEEKEEEKGEDEEGKKDKEEKENEEEKDEDGKDKEEDEKEEDENEEDNEEEEDENNEDEENEEENETNEQDNSGEGDENNDKSKTNKTKKK